MKGPTTFAFHLHDCVVHHSGRSSFCYDLPPAFLESLRSFEVVPAKESEPVGVAAGLLLCAKCYRNFVLAVAAAEQEWEEAAPALRPVAAVSTF